jgi:carbonic anhydrase
MLKNICLYIAFIMASVTDVKAQITSDSILTKLLEGNKRFVNQKTVHPDDGTMTIIKTAKAQKPFAVIHTCSDSRVSPELIFDQGIGDLFVQRVAGNVMGNGGLGSTEYAIEHLGVQFILVLGHTKCGAVSAAVSEEKTGGHISWLVEKIQPAYQKVKNLVGDKVDNTVRENVRQSVNEILMDAVMIDPALKTNVRIAGGIYHIEDGSVEMIIPPQPINVPLIRNGKNK